MYLEVRHAVLTIKRPHIDLEQINQMLDVALKYEFCDVLLTLDEENTRFDLHFKSIRTSVFVEQWVIFWMRPFGVHFELNFDSPLNGPELSARCSVAS